MIKDEDFMLALCKLAMQYNEEGCYDDANKALLQYVEDGGKIDDNSHNLWVQTAYALLFDQYAATCQWNHALDALEHLKQVCETLRDAYLYRNAKFHVLQGKYEQVCRLTFLYMEGNGVYSIEIE